MGRPTTLTPERQEKIVQAILAGNYFVVACRYAGVPEQVGYEWLARGEGKDPRGRPRTGLYASFAESVRQAEAQAETGTVAIIRQALPENPRLALDFLARRHPDRWGQRDTLTLLKGLAAEVDAMTDEEVAAYVSRRVGGQGENQADTGQGPAAGDRGPDNGQ